MTTTTIRHQHPLTVADLHATLTRDDHLGWGYACCGDIAESKRYRLDRAIVAEANALGLTAHDLFAWSNSKYGRWLADDITGCDQPPTRETVRRNLNAKAIDVLRRGE